MAKKSRKKSKSTPESPSPRTKSDEATRGAMGAEGSILQKSDVRRDGRTGLPRKIRGEFPLPAGDTAEDSVRALLAQNSDELGLKADENNLKLTQDIATPTGRVVRFQQLHDGIPVLDSTVLVQVDNANRAKQLHLEHVPDVLADIPSSDTKIKPKDAAKSALDSLDDPTLRQKLSDPEQVYYPTSQGLRLAYLVLILTQNPMHDWRLIVDAYSGEILEKEDLIKTSPDGSGYVFDPNPVVTANTNTLREPTATVAAGCGYNGSPLATIDAQRQTRTLKDLKLSGGVHSLDGPYAKIVNITAPASTIPTEANANNFKYSSSDERLGAVTVYYHIDTIQRYIQGLGVTTANNRQTQADPAVTGFSAYYSPVNKSLHMGTSRPCHPDKSQEGDAVIHEYGHAIQDNQVPGWGGTNPTTMRNESGAMGEGFGDTLACVFFANFGNQFQRETFEDWAYVENGAAGLRRVDGTKVYPTNWAGEVHDDGEIWSAALWNIYRTIGGDSMNLADRQAARDALLKTVILSHHLLLANASMPDGAEAVMDENAALNDYRGKHLIQMLNSFHDRGLLRSNAGVDLYIRDAAGDPGVDAFTGPVFWNSPDLWIRNSDDGGSTHQAPEFGQDNFFYARVRNRGTQTARAFVVTFNVKPWLGTEFVYPGDWIPFISAAVGYNLAPGASTVVKAKWPKAYVPATGTHACWLASVYTPVEPTPAGRHVWESNNLAQKNMTIVNLIPGDSIAIRFQLGSQFRLHPELFRLEVQRPPRWVSMPVAVVGPNPEVLKRIVTSVEEIRTPIEEPGAAVVTQPVQAQPMIHFLDPSRIEIIQRGANVNPVRLNLGADSTLDIGQASQGQQHASADVGDAEDVTVSTDQSGAGIIAFKPGVLSGFPVGLQPRTPVNLALKVTAPSEAKPGDVVTINLVQRNGQKQVVGGFTVQVNVVARKG
jgi:Fungalysin metallopeptidase (M36)/Fungalysin/Thermolysin Propeptide Motif